MTNPIPEEYFLNYAGRGRSYGKVWRDHSYCEECCELFAKKNAPAIKSIFVLGTSSGEILADFESKLKLRPYGCEISEWAYAQIPPKYRRRVKCQDMLEHIDELVEKKRIFDLVFSNSLIYLDPQRLEPFLKKLSHVCKYLHCRSSFKGDACPDIARTILQPYKWWDDLITSCGFEKYISGRARTYCWVSKRDF